MPIRPPPAIQVKDETHLYTLEEAARVDLPIKGKIERGEGSGEVEPTCPLCGTPVSQCTCGQEIEGGKPVEPLRGEGVPQQAFQQLSDLCHDWDVSHLSSLQITVQGDGKAGARNPRTLGEPIPYRGRVRIFHVELDVEKQDILSRQPPGAVWNTELDGDPLRAVADHLLNALRVNDYKATNLAPGSGHGVQAYGG